MKKQVFWVGIVALVMLMANPAAQAEQMFADNFDDDTGTLTGETATTGQTWADITGRTTLDVGTQFGQSSVGAGNDNSGSSWLWLANQVSLGDIASDGTVVLAADLTKNHLSSGGLTEINVNLKSSSQNRTTAMVWAADWLKMGANWTFGGGQVQTGVVNSIHAELMLELLAGGVNTATLSFYEIGNPSNNGTVALGSIEGELKYDTIEIWAYSKDSKVVGIDNISLTVASVPEPSTLAILVAGFVSLLAYFGTKRK